MRSTVLLALLLVTGCAAQADDEAPAVESAQSATGRVGVHGMVLAGDPSRAIISHIPMYDAPHDVQVVVRGAMSAGAGPALPLSFSDRGYTFRPDRTSLDALRTGVTRELRGTVYLGNFEQGGRPVASGVRFAVEQVVHQHLLVAAPPAALSYVVFGSRTRAFAVHYIAAAPSFDEVLAVTLGPDAPTDAELAAGVVAQVAGAQDVAPARLGLRTSRNVTLTFGAGGARKLTLRPVTTLSCLEGPDFFGPCP